MPNGFSPSGVKLSQDGYAIVERQVSCTSARQPTLASVCPNRVANRVFKTCRNAYHA